MVCSHGSRLLRGEACRFKRGESFAKPSASSSPHKALKACIQGSPLAFRVTESRCAAAAARAHSAIRAYLKRPGCGARTQQPFRQGQGAIINESLLSLYLLDGNILGTVPRVAGTRM